MAIFNFDTLIGTMGDTAKTVDERQTKERSKRIRDIAIEQSSTRRVAAVADQAEASRSATRKKQLEVLSGVDEQLGKAKEAIRLTDSQDPMDRVQLWMLQQSDPAYTRDGNLRRIEYYQAAAAAVGGIEEINQAGYADQMTSIQQDMELAKMEGAGELEMLKMSEDQGKERIQLYMDQQAAMAGTLQNQVSIQQAALTQLPAEGVAAATEEAKKSKDGKASVGGVMIPLSMLQERQTQLDDRAYLTETRQLERVGLILNNSTMDDVVALQAQAQKDGFAVKDGVKISMARLDERAAALTNRDYQMKLSTYQLSDLEDASKRKTDRKIIERGYSIPELREMVLNGGKDAEGQQFEPALVKEIYDQRIGLQSDKTALDLANMQMGDPMQAVVDQKTYLESFRAPAGSALETMITKQKSVMNVASKYVSDAGTGDETNAMVANQVLQGGREQVEAALKQTATDLSGGDKDMESILNFTLRGQPVPQDMLESILTTRVQKGKSLTQFLSKDSNAAFLSAFYTLKDEYAKSNPMMEPADIENMAAQEALGAVKQIAATGITDEVIMQQTYDKTNPVSGVFGPQEFLMLTKGADERGIKLYQQVMKLSDEDLKKTLANPPDDLAAAQAAQLMKDLDKKQPGLGRKYMDWWMSEQSQTFVRNYASNKYSTASGTSKQTELGLVLPDVPGFFSTYSQMLGQGDTYAHAQDFQREHTLFSQFGADSSIKQVFLLEQDANLTPTDKQVAYTTLIKPLLDVTRQQEMNSTQAAQFIESNLMSMQPNDTRAKAILKKVLAGRSGSLKVADDFVKAHNMGYVLTPGVYGVPPMSVNFNTGNQVDMATQAAGFDWFQQLGVK